MVCPISPKRYLTLFSAQDNYRSHHSWRAGNCISPQLCLKAWEHPEACDPYLFRRDGSRRHGGATCFHRTRRPESFRREGREDKGLCSGIHHDISGLEDAGRESRVEVCRGLRFPDLVGSRRPQPTIDVWGKHFFWLSYLSKLRYSRMFIAFAQPRTDS